jgi:hypothetical protein
MSEYKIFNFDEDFNKTVIFINSTEDLYFLQDEIYDIISKTDGERFTVLVDLFLRNGFSFNRFVSLKYNGKRDCKSIIVNPREVSEEIKSKINLYLREHESILENSALTTSVKYFVKRKLQNQNTPYNSLI